MVSPNVPSLKGILHKFSKILKKCFFIAGQKVVTGLHRFKRWLALAEFLRARWWSVMPEFERARRDRKIMRMVKNL